MALSYQQAIDLIGTPGYTGIDGLRRLAQETSAVAANAAPNAITLLYSGDVDGINAWKIAGPASADSVVGNFKQVVTLADTPLSKLLNDVVFTDAMRVAAGSEANFQLLMNGKDATGRITNTSIWDLASKQFADAAAGDVRTISPNAIENSVFYQTELPALLNNPNVTSVNGIHREDLLKLESDLLASGKDADLILFDRINTSSIEQTRAFAFAKDASGNLIVGTKDYFSTIGLSGMGTDLPADAMPYSPLLRQSPETIANAKLANDQLTNYAHENLALAEATGDAAKIRGARYYLAKLGVIATVLDVGLMANDAQAAYLTGTPEGVAAGNKIVTDWAISAASSGAASAAALAASSALIATAGLNLAPGVGTALNFAIAAVAGVVGGIYGPEVVTSMLNNFDPASGNTFRDGDYNVTRFGNGMEYRELAPISGTGTSTDPYVLPEVVVGAVKGSWTIPNADGTVTNIGIGVNNDSFTFSLKSNNSATATVLKSGDIAIDASGVHNTTSNINGWTTVTTDPATNEVISTSVTQKLPGGGIEETITYANGNVSQLVTLSNLQIKTTQIGNDVFRTTFNHSTHEFTFCVNDSTPFTATIMGGDGNDIPLNGTGKITTVVDGVEVVFNVKRTGKDAADPGGYEITGIASVGGALADDTTSAAVNKDLLDKHTTLTSVMVKTPALASMVAAVNKNSNGLVTEQTGGFLNSLGDFVHSMENLMSYCNARSEFIAMEFNGMHTVLTGVRTNDMLSVVNGVLQFSRGQYSIMLKDHPQDPNADLASNLAWAQQVVDDWTAGVGLRNAFRTGGDKALTLATLNAAKAAATTLSMHYTDLAKATTDNPALKQSYEDQVASYNSVAERVGVFLNYWSQVEGLDNAFKSGSGKAIVLATASATRLVASSMQAYYTGVQNAAVYGSKEYLAAKASAKEYGSVVQGIGYVLGAYSASQHIQQGRWWDAVFDIVYGWSEVVMNKRRGIQNRL